MHLLSTLLPTQSESECLSIILKQSLVLTTDLDRSQIHQNQVGQFIPTCTDETFGPTRQNIFVRIRIHSNRILST